MCCHTTPPFQRANVLKFTDLVKLNTAVFMYKAYQCMLPENIQRNFVKKDVMHLTRTNNNNNKYITSIALKSSGVRARKRNKTKSLIIFNNQGHIGVVISMRGRRQFKVEKQF